MPDSFSGRVRQHIRQNIYGLIAIFIALGGVSYAAGTVKKDTVVSKSIKDGQVKTEDLADDAATGAKVDESSLGKVPSAVTADSADTATTADSAATATTATNATNADTLDSISSEGFIQSGTAAQSAGFHVTNNSRIEGEIRQGSETGTTEGPNVFGNPTGVITRRITSTSSTAGNVLARSSDMTLERDGTNGGLRISYTLGGGLRSLSCIGLTSGSNAANIYVNIPNVTAAFTFYTDGQNVVQAHCEFGYPSGGGDTTSVDLFRYPGDVEWVGFVTSTVNQ